MSGAIQKKKLKFSRNPDGSLGAPKNVGYDTESLNTIEHLNKNIRRDETLYKKEVAVNKKSQKQNNYSKQAIKLKATNYKKSLIKKLKSIELKPSIKYPKINNKKYFYSIAVVALVFVLSFFIINNFTNNNDQQQVKSDTTAVTKKIETNTKPVFSVLTPMGAGVDALGGFAKISPEGSPPVYAYVDKIGDVPIKVSQQELPDKFKQNRESELKELATQFNAKDPLMVGDFTAYIGQSVKGPQSVVYAKGNNLVLIASDSKIENTEWITYLGKLKY